MLWLDRYIVKSSLTYWLGLLCDIYGTPIHLGQTLAGLRAYNIGLEFRILIGSFPELAHQP